MAIAEVVEYNGQPNVYAWKYPGEELGTWTQLIVNGCQEAVLFKGGKALDVFPSGSHTLDTANIPMLNEILNLPFGGQSPFTAEVWYVNKLFKLDIKWETASPIQIQDPTLEILVPIHTNGMFGIQVVEPKKFLVKLIDTIPGFDEQSVIDYFRDLYTTKVKEAILAYVVKERVIVVNLNAHLDVLSTFIQERIEQEMAEYGIKLMNSYVYEISFPNDDLFAKTLHEALVKRAEREIHAMSNQQECAIETMETTVKKMVCPQCGAENKGTRFCPECGAPLAKICPKCGALISGSPKFCSECGQDLRG